MFKKKKIREEFEDYFKSGNETMIKKMLDENPWLLNEWQGKMDENVSEQSLIVSALGVMIDENGGDPVPIDDVLFSLRVDFKTKKDDDTVKQMLNDAETLGYCKPTQGGWLLTPEGERICDDYLNSHIDLLGSEI
ncbi:MAG: hypothetical protein GF364_12025 [Candidatus Lokiarchaeota archaeon]|nr:hypothetical protein [Candidatus Lokiarchaeota archaeon]